MKLKYRSRHATYEDEPFGSPARGKLFAKQCSGPAGQWFGTLACIAIGLALGIATGSWSDLARSFRNFEEAQGIITTLSPAREVRSRRSTTFAVDATYSFAVNGIVHTGSRVGRSGISIRAAEERALRDRYQRGAPVTICYARNGPSNNYIKVEGTDARQRVGSLVGSVAGSVFTGLGVFCLARLIIHGPVRYHA